MAWNAPACEEIPDVLLDSGDFYPQVPLKRFYEEYRIPLDVPRVTVVNHLKTAIIRTKRDLADWRKVQTAPTLEEIPQEEIDGTGELTDLFFRAVYCYAKSYLLRETETVAQKKEAENLAKTGVETEKNYLTQAAEAVRLLIGDEVIGIHFI